MCAKEEEEEEEAVFISVVNTNEDPPNAHQAQDCPKPKEEVVVVFTCKNREGFGTAKPSTLIPEPCNGTLEL